MSLSKTLHKNHGEGVAHSSATYRLSVHRIAMSNLNLTIENMHCGACVRRVTQTLNALPGTHAEEVQIGAARVSTEADPKQIEEALRTAGYPAHIAS